MPKESLQYANYVTSSSYDVICVTSRAPTLVLVPSDLSAALNEMSNFLCELIMQCDVISMYFTS